MLFLLDTILPYSRLISAARMLFLQMDSCVDCVTKCVFVTLVSPKAVESWEQGGRRPREATLKLLIIAHKHPEVFLVRE